MNDYLKLFFSWIAGIVVIDLIFIIPAVFIFKMSTESPNILFIAIVVAVGICWTVSCIETISDIRKSKQKRGSE